MAKKIALITGASSGIGWAFTEVFAEKGYDLIVTARREERLLALKNQLADQFSCTVIPIIADLNQPKAVEQLAHDIKEKKLSVDVLVNNAGFGAFGLFTELDVQVITDMIQVNVTALVQLTHAFSKEMVQQGHGHILNVASMAGFVPGPLMSIYFASKSFVLSFSEAIANELQGTGVGVTALCPGPVKSEFQAVAYHESPEMTDKRNIPTSKETAEFGYQAMMNNQVIAITGFKNNLLPFLARILPRSLITRIVRTKQNSHYESMPS